MNAKLNKYSLDDARKMAKEYDEETKNIRFNYMKSHSNEYNTIPEKKLEELQYRILVENFKEELKK